MAAPTVLVTRPAAQAAGWVERLRAAGIDAEALPLIAIEPSADLPALQRAWRGLSTQALVMFVSPNAVTGFFCARPAGASWPETLRAGATGPGTVEALVAAGVARARCVAPQGPPYDSAALWRQLQAEPWPGRAVLIVRGDGGRDEFAQALRHAGAQVDFVSAYQRSTPTWSATERARAEAALAAPEKHVWLLSSGEAVGHLERLLPQARWQASRALASHERIAARAREAGFGQVSEVPPTLEAIVAALSGAAKAAP
jgi:uroporphyrinogen-III synthase